MVKISVEPRQKEPENEDANENAKCCNCATKEPSPKKSSKATLKEIQDNYGNTFTFHGLSRVYGGHPVEKVFWFLMLIGALAVCSYASYNLLQKYSRREVLVQVSSRFPFRIQLPSITLCSFTRFMKKRKCYKGKLWSVHEGTFSYSDCFNDTQKEIFFLEWCRQGGDRVDCTPRTKTLLDGACITLNPDGDLFQAWPGEAGEVSFMVDIQDENEVQKNDFYIYIHNHTEVPFISEYGLINYLNVNSSYRIKIGVTEYYRLQVPFESQCVEGNTATQNIFGGNLTQMKCIKSCHAIDMMETCGDVSDYIKEYTTPGFFDQFRTSASTWTDGEKATCIDDHHENSYVTLEADCELCPLTCYEKAYWADVRRDEVFFPPPRQSVIRIGLMLADIEIKTVKEKAAYSGAELFADSGGLLGLLAGTSLLSLVEIVLFLIVSIVALFFK